MQKMLNETSNRQAPRKLTVIAWRKTYIAIAYLQSFSIPKIVQVTMIL